MRHVKTYEKFSELDLFQKDFEKYLPKELTIIKQVNNEIIRRKFKLSDDNIMRHANMTQITYIADEKIFGHPDEMSIDMYYYLENGLKLNFDIIYGDISVCEFTCRPPDDIQIIEYTSYHSKFNPGNQVFAFSDESISNLCGFINRIQGFNILPYQLNFLDIRDNFRQ